MLEAAAENRLPRLQDAIHAGAKNFAQAAKEAMSYRNAPIVYYLFAYLNTSDLFDLLKDADEAEWDRMRDRINEEITNRGAGGMSNEFILMTDSIGSYVGSIGSFVDIDLQDDPNSLTASIVIDTITEDMAKGLVDDYNEYFQPTLPPAGDKCHLTYEAFSKYQIIPEKILGKGYHGIVCESIYKPTGEHIAVKINDKSSMDKQAVSSYIHECRILSQLKHINIINIHGAYDDGDRLFFFFDRMAGGTLYGLISRELGPLPIELIRHYFQQMVNAVKACHQQNIVHRDIKPENMVLREARRSTLLTLIDFGFATPQTDFDFDLTEIVGTPFYMPPEIWTRKPYRGKPFDIWSLGVTLSLMCNYAQPFPLSHGEDLPVLSERIRNDQPIFRRNMDPLARGLVLEMLHKDPTQRPTIDEVNDHPFLKFYRD